MTQPFRLSRALGCAASVILLCGVALAQQQTRPAPSPARVSVSAPSSAMSPIGPSTVPLPAAPPAKDAPATGSGPSTAKSSEPVREDETSLIEGEKRFATNCGRCHQAPHKFPPRMMATIVRHMRVRATITDQDMRLILLYMTQ